jgi:serine/threonine protein kinase
LLNHESEGFSNEKGWKFALGDCNCDNVANLLGVSSIDLLIKELHKRNIIHRDLKLENIMIVDKKCKIIDLGLSKKLESESKVMVTNVGTDYTKAPEVKGWRDSSGYGLVVLISS